jgi:hypothetical protein
MVGNHENMQWQLEWAGFKLYNKRILVYPDEYDRPQEQFRTIVFPPDPTPIINARPENYTIDEETFRVTQSGLQRYQMDGTPRVQSNLQGQPFLTTESVTAPLVLTTDGGDWLTEG